MREYNYVVQVANENGCYEDYRMFELEATALKCAWFQCNKFGKSAIVWNLNNGTLVEEYVI